MLRPDSFIVKNSDNHCLLLRTPNTEDFMVPLSRQTFDLKRDMTLKTFFFFKYDILYIYDRL